MFSSLDVVLLQSPQLGTLDSPLTCDVLMKVSHFCAWGLKEWGIYVLLRWLYDSYGCVPELGTWDLRV